MRQSTFYPANRHKIPVSQRFSMRRPARTPPPDAAASIAAYVFIIPDTREIARKFKELSAVFLSPKYGKARISAEFVPSGRSLRPQGMRPRAFRRPRGCRTRLFPTCTARRPAAYELPQILFLQSTLDNLCKACYAYFAKLT